MVDRETQGARIRALFEDTAVEFMLIAPFIKVDALRSLLEIIPAEPHLRCVTRWLPRDIAAGVSDPEILDLLERRGNFSLSLVDELHAKIYIAGNRCLAGSANITLAGLGERGDGGNIEVLVETTVDDPGIAATLDAVALSERPATRSMARTARRLAEIVLSEGGQDVPWFPRSRRPEHAFRIYTQQPGRLDKAADHVLLADLARSNLPVGLEKDEFRDAVRSMLAAIPHAETLLEATEDSTLTRADASSWLERIAGEEFTARELWIAFVHWMAYFHPDRVMKQEITEIALRRARLLGSS